MRPRYLLLLLIACASLTVYAQPGRQGYHNDRRPEELSSLSVFSEDGQLFLLVLNGISQNTVPASRIRIEGLPQYGNDIEIIFTDRRTQAIHKRLTIADPVDGKAVDMALKIVNYDGYTRLKFHSSMEVTHNYHAQQGECIMYYGRPNQVNTVTTTDMQPARQQSQPMDNRTFADAKKSIAAASFDDTKLSTAKTILAGNYITTSQVMELCRQFSFEETRLAFAEFAYGKTVDPNNYFKVGSIFSFDANKQALNEFINSRKPE